MGLLACSPVTEPPLPRGTIQFSPPPIYNGWWAMTEACSGITASMDAIGWYVAPPGATLLGSRDIGGYWSMASNHIVLSAESQLDGGLVRHEMLHALLRAPTHVRSQFLGRCAGVVPCDMACVADAGRAPAIDPAWPRVSPDSLELGLDVSPAQPGSATNWGYFTFTVTARNTRADTVVVTLPRAADGGHSVSFGFDAASQGSQASYEDRAWDTSVSVFAPGEIKREVFDLTVNDAPDTMRPGTWSVRGTYGERWTAPQSVLVRQ